MIILGASYINFRNLTDDHIRFSPKLNLFYGKNGQGKTNLLEALYFGGTGKSFKTKKISEAIKYGKNKMGISLSYSDKISEKQLIIKLQEGRREYSFNNKKVPYDEYYGKLNIISHIPEDVTIINGMPLIRRDFFDSEIAQVNSDFFKYIKYFNDLLKIRNKYLKEKKHKDPEFQIYQDDFIKYGTLITKTRLDYVKMLSALLSLNYRKLFDNTKELLLEYDCSLGDMKKRSINEISTAMKKKIQILFEQELHYGFSMVGPQKDDFVFLLDSHEVKANASQGEKKSVVFSLKLAEIDMMIRDKKENPVLLIDDVTSYFDKTRLNNVLKYLEKRNIQTFMSSTEDLDLDSYDLYVECGDVSNDKT